MIYRSILLQEYNNIYTLSVCIQWSTGLTQIVRRPAITHKDLKERERDAKNTIDLLILIKRWRFVLIGTKTIK